jgi:hypothetical protein
LATRSGAFNFLGMLVVGWQLWNWVLGCASPFCHHCRTSLCHNQACCSSHHHTSLPCNATIVHTSEAAMRLARQGLRSALRGGAGVLVCAEVCLPALPVLHTRLRGGAEGHATSIPGCLKPLDLLMAMEVLLFCIVPSFHSLGERAKANFFFSAWQF